MAEIVKPAQLAPRLRSFAAAQGMAGLERFGGAVPTTMHVADLIALFAAFFEGYDVEGRAKAANAQGVHEDDLLYQHGPAGANVTRQLYRNRRGVQVGVSLGLAPPPRTQVSLWLGKCGSIEVWRERAEAAARAAGIFERPAVTLQASTDRF